MTPLLGRGKVDRQTHRDNNTTRKREETESDTSTDAAPRRRDRRTDRHQTKVAEADINCSETKPEVIETNTQAGRQAEHSQAVKDVQVDVFRDTARQ